jgi:hypothetical protein
MSSIGLCTERGNQDCFFYDNILFNNAINLRIHSYWAPGFARREYHFRNILYQSPKRGGVHMFVHYRTEPWPGEPEDPELFIYHNTFSGGSPTMITTRGFNIAAANKHRKTVLINNVFSSPGRSLSEPVFWSNPEVFEAMDYNWLALAFGQPARGAKQPKWFGEHNITQEGRLLWETGMINFTLPETSAARNSGIDLSKPFSICGKDYSALPGMEPGYFSGKAPHMGALQEGKTLSADVMSELKME